MILINFKKTMLIILSMLLVINILPSMPVFAAYEGSCGDGVYYSFEQSTGTLTISGHGNMNNFALSEVPWNSYKESIEKVTIENGVKSIGSLAFYGCSKLTGSLIIPDSVTSVGWCAFKLCKGLTLVKIGNNVTSISKGAFEGCVGLSSVDIPASVTSICRSTFNGCTGLTDINIDPNNKIYSSSNGVVIKNNILIFCPEGKTGSYAVPSNVTYIREFAFSDCRNLTSITIPDSVISIEAGAFLNCSGLISIDIPESLIFVGKNAFSGCSVLKEGVVYKLAAKQDDLYFDKEGRIYKCDYAKSVMTLVGGNSNNVPKNVTIYVREKNMQQKIYEREIPRVEYKVQCKEGSGFIPWVIGLE